VNDELAVRSAALYVPVLATAALWAWRRPDRQLGAGALLATLWNVPVVLGLAPVAARTGWFGFAADDALLLGVPVDLLVGWALLWGAIPVLALPGRPVLAAVAVLWVDVALMPLLEPVVWLGEGWLAGDLAGAVLGLGPAVALGSMTAARTRLAARVAAQAVLFAALVVVVLPSALLAWSGTGWGPLLARPAWQLALAAQVLAVPAAAGLAAVMELAVRGGGTPLPFDPPDRLVRSGPYAYVANPMQVAMTAVLAGVGLLAGSWPVLAAAAIGVVFCAGMAAWHEDAVLARRFGPAWRAYRRLVRPWLPHLRPPAPPAARLYAATTCDPCSQLAGWLRAQHPRALTLEPAETLQPLPERRTYLPADGTRPAEAVTALARALEHVHLGWALVGWCLRLPVVAPLAQLLADAVGAGPRTLRPGERYPAARGPDAGPGSPAAVRGRARRR